MLWQHFSWIVDICLLASSVLCTAQVNPPPAPPVTDSSSTSAKSVEQWGIFEAAVSNSKTYADPYKDVRLNVTYRRPDGSSVVFWGFHDGGKTWKIRFMPDMPGTWQYTAVFGDGTPGAEGRFQVQANAKGGLIGAYKPNPIWFARKGTPNDIPLQIRSFHTGSNFFADGFDDPTSQGDGNKRTVLLNWLQKQGYNTISSGQFFSGKAVPKGTIMKSSRLWPLDAIQFQKIELILNDLLAREMIVYPFYGFFGNGTGFPTDKASQQRYVEYVIARFGPYRNLLFNVAGPEPNLKGWLSASQVDELGNMIAKADVFGHLLGVHNKDGDDPHRQETWNSLPTLQGEFTDLAELNAYFLGNHTGKSPVYAQETLWPGNKLQPFQNASMSTVRQHAWVHALSAVALNYGDQNGNNSSGFSGTLNVADAIAERHDVPKKVWDFMESVPFYRMKPCPEVTAKQAACLGEADRHYLIYFPKRQGLSLTLPGSSYTGRWIDGANPLSKSVPLPKAQPGMMFTPPQGGQDWVLELRTSAAAPTAMQPASR